MGANVTEVVPKPSVAGPKRSSKGKVVVGVDGSQAGRDAVFEVPSHGSAVGGPDRADDVAEEVGDFASHFRRPAVGDFKRGANQRKKIVVHE